MFYYERKNIFGKWSPETSPERPGSKSASGVRREIRNVHEVPVHMEAVGLGVLQRHFNPGPTPEQMASVTKKFAEPRAAYCPGFPLSEDDLFEVMAHHHGVDFRYGDGVYSFKQDGLLKLMEVLTEPATLLTMLANRVHADNVAAGWWTDLKTGEDLHGKRNMGELLMLVVTELAEGYEGVRKGLMDDKLPHRPMLRVELIDAIIRMLDILGSQDNEEHPAGVIFQEKRAYNAKRADHKPEARLAVGGKAF